MSQFEQIVRPFQRIGVSYPTRIFDPSQEAVTDMTLVLGQVGSTKTFQVSFSETVNTYADAEIKEKSRETTKKHITNPDDEDQFVDVEIIKKLTTEQGKGKDYKKSIYQFKNS